jgi:peptidyl-dipeptidase A
VAPPSGVLHHPPRREVAMERFLGSICAALLCAAACDGPPSTVDISKLDAREVDRRSWGTDYCATQRWYGDGECDEFCPAPDPDCDAALEAKAQAFIDAYVKRYAPAERDLVLADWKASTTGAAEDYDASNAAQIAIFLVHIDPALYDQLKAVFDQRAKLALFTRRSLEDVEPNFLALKLGAAELTSMLQVMQLRNDVLGTFNNYKGVVDGQEYSISELHDLQLRSDHPTRQKIWEALKGVGPKIAPKILEGIKAANIVARSIGYASYWEYSLRSSDIEPTQLVAIFDELDRQTSAPYAATKPAVDQEVASQRGIPVSEVAIWDYDTEFFQDAPPTPGVDLDAFFRDRPKETIVELAGTFFSRLGLNVDDVLARSDLYPRAGKWPGAFTTSIDRQGDIRVLLNTRSNLGSMETALHELGHAADAKNLDDKLPFLLRTSNHIFTTEAMAMLLEGQSLTPELYVELLGADAAAVARATLAMLERQRRGELIFARYALVMFHFEKALYENPDQDLNALWWSLAQRYQLLQRPPGRDGASDWASKTHFASNPVYYHNYSLGKLFVAQLRSVLARRARYEGPLLGFSLLGRPDAVELLRQKVFRVGRRMHWWELVERATGEKLQVKAFGEEVRH